MPIHTKHIVLQTTKQKKCISSGETLELDYTYQGSGTPSDISIYVSGVGIGSYSWGYSWSADTLNYSDTCY